jgi:predicted nucleic acid-binding protein
LKTFLDSGVLLHAWRGATLSGAAMQVIADDSRQFFSSQMVRLELLPKAQFEKRRTEVAFYEAHFADCTGSEPLSEELGRDAEKLAIRYGLAGPDALQLAAAVRQGVQEFYTSEKPGKPMFRVQELKVISLFSLLT